MRILPNISLNMPHSKISSEHFFSGIVLNKKFQLAENVLRPHPRILRLILCETFKQIAQDKNCICICDCLLNFRVIRNSKRRLSF